MTKGPGSSPDVGNGKRSDEADDVAGRVAGINLAKFLWQNDSQALLRIEGHFQTLRVRKASDFLLPCPNAVLQGRWNLDGLNVPISFSQKSLLYSQRPKLK